MMKTFVVDDRCVRVPDWVVDLSSVRRWAHSDEIPEKVHIGYLDGEVWVDLSLEQLFSHNQVKGEYGYVLAGLIKADRLGLYVPNRILLTNVDANFSTGPDAFFVSEESLRIGRVLLEEGDPEGGIELEGSPDMVLEIVSQSSVEKDTMILPDLYWRARIREYWLVDARGDRLVFDIYRYTPKGYIATRHRAGWIKVGGLRQIVSIHTSDR